MVKDQRAADIDMDLLAVPLEFPAKQLAAAQPKTDAGVILEIVGRQRQRVTCKVVR